MKKFLFAILLLSQFIIGQTITLNHKFYDIKFSLDLKQPIYTHYVMTEEMNSNQFLRTDFKPDRLLKTKQQGAASDYKNSSYDKGHLAPNDDFRFDLDAQLESMYYTNCAPQNHALNIGIWRSLENYVRKKSKSYDVEVWTGCIYDGSQEHVGKLLVPTYFWKLIKYNGKYEAYKILNKKPNKSAKYTDFKVDVDELLKLIDNG